MADPVQDDDSTPAGLRRLVEERNARIKELEDEVQSKASVERELIARRAGLNLSEPKFDALFGAHKGELTPEALKETALALEFIQPDPDPAPDPDTDAAHRIGAASTGTEPPPGPPTDLEARIRACNGDQDKVMAIMREAGHVAQF